MKFKIIFFLLFISIIISGIFAFNSDNVSDSASKLSDTTNQEIVTLPDSNTEITQLDTEQQNQQTDRSKSNILILSDYKKGGFSIITILRGLLGMLVLIGISYIFYLSIIGFFSPFINYFFPVC